MLQTRMLCQFNISSGHLKLGFYSHRRNLSALSFTNSKPVYSLLNKDPRKAAIEFLQLNSTVRKENQFEYVSTSIYALDLLSLLNVDMGRNLEWPDMTGGVWSWSEMCRKSVSTNEIIWYLSSNQSQAWKLCSFSSLSGMQVSWYWFDIVWYLLSQCINNSTTHLTLSCHYYAGD